MISLGKLTRSIGERYRASKKMSKGLVFVIALILIGLIVVPSYAANNECTAYPQLRVTESVSLTSEHAIWVYAKKESSAATPYIQVNGGDCIQLSVPAGDGWEWVTGTGWTITQNLSEGSNNIDFYVNNGAVLMDKVLATSDVECVPKGSGENCVQEQLDYYVDGIDSSSTINGPVPIRANILTNSPGAVIKFFIDDKQIAERVSEPYCMAVVNNVCSAYDFAANDLSTGTHNLKVVGSVQGQESVEKNRTFTLASQSTPNPTPIPIPVPSPAPAPNPTPTPIPAPSSTPTIISTQDTVLLNIDGVADADRISGLRTIKANVSGSESIKVDFKINDRVYASDTTAPYCMVEGAGEVCGEFNTATLGNGSYVFSVVASSPTAKSTVKTMKVDIENKLTSAPLLPQTAENSPVLVVGVTNQRVAGNVRVTVPANRTENASTVTYSLDATPLTTVPASSPTTTIDMSDYVDDTATITATVSKNNGEKETLQSTVSVNNNPILLLARYMLNHFILSIVSIVGLSIGSYLLVHYISGKITARKLAKQHNLIGTYSYVQPQETVMRQRVFGGLTALMVVFVGVFSFTQLGTYAQTTNLGFISEIENGTKPAEYQTIAENDVVYVRLNYLTPPTTTPTPNPTPAPNPAPTPTPTPTPPPITNGSTFRTNFDNCSTITACGFFVLPGNGPHDFAYPGPDGSAFGPISIWGGEAHAEGGQREGVAATTITVGNDQFAEATVNVGPVWTGSYMDYTGVTVRTARNSSTGHYQWYKFEIYEGAYRIVSLYYEPSLGRHYFRECASASGIFTNSRYKMRLEIRGQTLTGKMNDVKVLECTDTSASAIWSGGTPGIHMQGRNLTIDDFSAGAL